MTEQKHGTMATLTNDPATISSLSSRIRSLRPDASRQWGTMRTDQMLRHLNAVLEVALGKTPTDSKGMGVLGKLMKYAVFYGPWPKGKTPTAPMYEARDTYDFDTERKRLLGNLEELGRRAPEGEWPLHPMFGRIHGKHWIHGQIRHIDHHLRQFGV